MAVSGEEKQGQGQRCLACRFEGGGDFRDHLQFGGSRNNSNLNKQLWNVFIARKLLGVGRGTLEELLRREKGRRNPGSWFWVCEQCSRILGRAWEVQARIGRLEEELRVLGRRWRTRIMEGRKEEVEGQEWTLVEKRILRAIEKDEQTIWRRKKTENREELEEEVKREVASPEREDEWEEEPLGRNEETPGRKSPGSRSLEEEDPVEPLVKIEVDEATQEDKRVEGEFSDGGGNLKAGGGSASSFNLSEEEDDWKPKRRKMLTRGRKRKVPQQEPEISDGDDDAGEKNKSSVRAVASRKKRRTNSVKKAKSSLRAKKAESGGGRVRKASSTRKRPSKIQCPRCAAMFRNEAEMAPHLKLHQKTDEQGNKWDCKTCGYPCESERSQRQHMSLKHELQKYICDICGYEAPRKGRLARHKKLHEKMVDPKTYQCDLCSEKFDNYIGFTRHQRQQHAEELNINLFKCDKCPSVYTTNKMLQDHILHVHEKNSRWCCDICGKGLLSEKNLKEHLETHEHRERTEICWVCGVDFLNNRSLREHVRKFHPTQHQTKYSRGPPKSPKAGEADKEFKCLYCSFTSPFRLVVMRHRKTHREVFRHLCEICSNEYSSLASLVLHKKINHGDGKTIVTCEWCGKSFAHKHYLQNHVPRCKMRPSDVPLPKSKKPFRDSLLVRPPGEEAPTPEPEMEMKKNKKKSGMSDVSRPSKETGSGSVTVCKYCHEFSTDNRGKMYGHVMKAHKAELEFKWSCELCGTKYVSKPSLNRHVAIHHSSDNVMACVYCQKVFRHWSLLRLHYKHSCKSMPVGAPIPECPNKREAKKEVTGEEEKGKKYREQRNRKGAGFGLGAQVKRRKGQVAQVPLYFAGGQEGDSSGAEGIMGRGAVFGGAEQGVGQPPTGTHVQNLGFPLVYPSASAHGSEQVGGGGTTFVEHSIGSSGAAEGGGTEGNAAAAAAVAVQMFTVYNSQGGQAGGIGGGGGNSGGGGQRGWW